MLVVVSTILLLLSTKTELVVNAQEQQEPVLPLGGDNGTVPDANNKIDPEVGTSFAVVCKILSNAPLISLQVEESLQGGDTVFSVESDSEDDSWSPDDEARFGHYDSNRRRQQQLREQSVLLQDAVSTLPPDELGTNNNNASIINNGVSNTGNMGTTSGNASDSTATTAITSRNNRTILVRECPCAPTIYCEQSFDICGIPASSTGEQDGTLKIGCFAQSSKDTLLRNAWPLLLLWYATLLFMLLCTDRGRHARNYVKLRAFRNTQTNERIVDHFLHIHGFGNANTANNNINNNNENAQPQRGDGVYNNNNLLPIANLVQRQPTELLLRTSIYGTEDIHYHHHYDDNDNDSAQEQEPESCTICFSPLQQGERVGVLSCHHIFHVTCLREWLPRRNVCPLCQDTNAATPRYDNDDDNGVAETSDANRGNGAGLQQRQQQRQIPLEVEATVELEGDRRGQSNESVGSNPTTSIFAFSRWRM
jgi:hypothetical protein